jgi:hypothetical protein
LTGAVEAVALPVPNTCTVSNLNVTVLGAMNTSTASVAVGTSSLAELQAGEVGVSVVDCSVTANQGNPVTCTSTASFSDSPGDFLSIFAYNFSNSADFANAHVLASFTCD